MVDEPKRDRMAPIRAGATRKFSVPYIEGRDENGQEIVKRFKFWVTANVYEDGRIGEIFVHGDREGLAGQYTGFLDVFAITVSLGLQYGVPLQSITSKLRGQAFGPSGFTGDKDMPSCSSVFDAIAQWLDKRFPDGKLKLDNAPTDVKT